MLLTGAALAQDEPAPPPAADQAALEVAFQRAVDRFVALEAMPEQATLDELIAELDDLAARSNGQPDVLLIKALCHARLARLFLDQRRDLDQEYDDLKEKQRLEATDEMNRKLADMAGPRLDLAERVAAEYANVNDVLTLALERADAIRAMPEANLIRGVVLTQAAIVNDRVLEAAAAAAEAGVQAADVPARQMRSLLDQAQELLSDYLKPENTPKENGLEWIRGQFYLGVVEYRRSLVDRVSREVYETKVDPDRTAAFDRAREIFAGLADSAVVLAILRGPESPEEGRETIAQAAFRRSSFRSRNYTEKDVADFYAASANLYLGLIASITPELELRERLDSAVVFLDQAVKLDRSDPQAASLTGDMIPTSVSRVKRALEEALEAPPLRKPLNDLTLSFGMTALMDSNVILLGRSSEPPIYKSRKRDFRVGALFKMNYVMDLDALTPNNEGGPLSKWQLLFELRTAPTWNARIHDFNEQYYGGTLNLRYEFAGADEIENIDGLYLHTRYDYDYILLGNDGFLRVNRIRPSFEIVAFDQVLDTTLFFGYEDRNYLEQLRDERFDRDGNYFSWGVDTLFDLGKWISAESLWKDAAWGRAAPLEGDRDYRRPMEVTLGFDFTTNSTQGDQFDYSSQILTVGVKLPLPYGVDFTTNALFEWQDYRGNSLVDHRRRGRKDFIQEYGFRFERAFYLTRDYDPNDYAFTRPLKLSRLIMTISGDIRIIIDDSNVKDRLGQRVFEYNRFIYGAGVRFDLD